VPARRRVRGRLPLEAVRAQRCLVGMIVPGSLRAERGRRRERATVREVVAIDEIPDQPPQKESEKRNTGEGARTSESIQVGEVLRFGEMRESPAAQRFASVVRAPRPGRCCDRAEGRFVAFCVARALTGGLSASTPVLATRGTGAHARAGRVRRRDRACRLGRQGAGAALRRPDDRPGSNAWVHGGAKSASRCRGVPPGKRQHMRGVITGKDVLRHSVAICRLWGPGSRRHPCRNLR